jgi:hypothetical protein
MRLQARRRYCPLYQQWIWCRVKYKQRVKQRVELDQLTQKSAVNKKEVVKLELSREKQMSTVAAYVGIRTIQRQEARSNDSQNKLAVLANTLAVNLPCPELGTEKVAQKSASKCPEVGHTTKELTKLKSGPVPVEWLLI